MTENERLTFEKEIRAKAIEEFAEKLKYELNGNIIPDNEKVYIRKKTARANLSSKHDFKKSNKVC